MFTLKYLIILLSLIGVVVCFILHKYMEGVLTFCVATLLDHLIDMHIWDRSQRR